MPELIFHALALGNFPLRLFKQPRIFKGHGDLPTQYGQQVHVFLTERVSAQRAAHVQYA